MAILRLQPAFTEPGSPFSRDEIEAACQRLRGRIHRTPVLENGWLNRQLGGRVFFKCEPFQRGGAFKIRGAMNAVLQLECDQAMRGVITHSSGNHAQALAIAAEELGIPCTVVMPKNSPAVKMQATADHGAKIILCEPIQADRVATTQAEIERTGATLVHPFDHPDIILGQATAAWELLVEVPDLDWIVAPVGGGGLVSGTCLTANWFHADRRIPVLAAEPEGADDAFRSLESQQLVTEHQPRTIADGLLTTLGSLTWPIIKSHLSGIVTVSDLEIQSAMQVLWERLKWVVEPSGAVSLAGLQQAWQHLYKPSNQDSATETHPVPKVGVILSGGNRDFVKL